jgi:hypothetical protein
VTFNPTENPMNRWKTLTLALALVPALSFAQQAEKAPESKAHVLTRAELDALLTKPEQVLIVDVRRPDELTSIGGFPVYLSEVTLPPPRAP